jgi:hypothetical protein
MTPARFLRTVVLLWGDHWIKPCQSLLSKHGHSYSRQQLWNFKKGNSPVPEHVEVLLERQWKSRQRLTTRS